MPTIPKKSEKSNRKRLLSVLVCTTTLFAASSQGANAANQAALSEILQLKSTASVEANRPIYEQRMAKKYTDDENVFMPSAMEVDFTYRNASVTLPLYRGVTPDGNDAWYIITESSDKVISDELGIIYSPKLRHVKKSPQGIQEVDIRRGVMRFKGDVDFSPELIMIPGDGDKPFPPKKIQAGAVADAEWSSMVVTPEGIVLNVQMVMNETGSHDRLKGIDRTNRTVKMSLLDGFEDGEQYYYHLVTDASAEIAAVLEQGVFSPRLAKINNHGESETDSSLLGFSPVLNGPRDPRTGQEQGFEALLANGGIDPINVFPLDPNTDDTSSRYNYSPLWDAHVSQWTDKAIADGKRRRITSLKDLNSLVRKGYVESAFVNPPGKGNAYIAGLRPTGIIINCPVIAQPKQSAVTRYTRQARLDRTR